MAGDEGKKLPYLPTNSVVEVDILPRFPVKSLLRFKSVSKCWRALISYHLHQFHVAKATSGLFFRLPISASNKFYAITATTQLSKTNVNTTLSFLPPHDNLHIIDCCNGLLLCRFFSPKDHDMVLCVCNPLTERYAIIPEAFHSSWESLVLVFEPLISYDFMIIYFGRFDLQIFSSDIGEWVTRPQIGYSVYQLSLINENHIFVLGEIYLASDKDPFIVVLDWEGGYIARIDLPHSALGFRRRRLGYSRGRLCYALKVDGEMRVWVLEDFDKSRWLLKCSVSLEVMLPGSSQGTSSDHLHIMSFHPDLDLVYVRVEDKLLSYDLSSGNLVEVCTCGILKGQVVFSYSPFYSEDMDL